MSNKIIYIKICINGADFYKCTSTNRMQKDIESIVEKNFKKGTKITKSYQVLSEHGKAFNE